MSNPSCVLCRESSETVEEAKDANRQLVNVVCRTCGHYTLSYELHRHLARNPEDDHRLVAGFTRRSPDSTLTIERITEILLSAPRTAEERMDSLILELARLFPKAGMFLNIDLRHDWPLAYAVDTEELIFYLDSLEEAGLLKASYEALTIEGWRRVRELRASRGTGSQGFIAVWFDDAMLPARKAIADGIIEAGFQPFSVDLVADRDAGKIDDRIVAEIRRSRFMVADVSGERPNVYFEAGFAMGLGIPILWTCRKGDALHFDTRQFSHIIWGSPQELQEKLANRIRARIIG